MNHLLKVGTYIISFKELGQYISISLKHNILIYFSLVIQTLVHDMGDPVQLFLLAEGVQISSQKFALMTEPQVIEYVDMSPPNSTSAFLLYHCA